MSDRIELRGIEAETVLGWREDERARPRPVLIDLDLSLDLRDAGASDDLSDTADYDALVQAVRAAVAGSSRRLVEALAEDVARVCLAVPQVRGVTVTVHKPRAVAGCAVVAVRITR